MQTFGWEAGLTLPSGSTAHTEVTSVLPLSLDTVHCTSGLLTLMVISAVTPSPLALWFLRSRLVEPAPGEHSWEGELRTGLL